MKKVLKIAIPIFCFALIIGIVVFLRIQNRTKFNDGYVNGNTAGNLYNSGLFCEKDGMVYFANPSDGNKLYRMNSDGSDIKKLFDESVSFINVDDNYIYYARVSNSMGGTFPFLSFNTNSLCRAQRNGKGTAVILDSAPSMYASLSGNYIYYLHYDSQSATTLYRTKIDGSDQNQIDKNPYFTCATNGRYLYYNGLENDHNIYQYDTATSSQSLLYAGNCWMPIVERTTAYFMDCDNDYKLAKVDLSTGEKTLLCDDRVDSYNIYGSYIYFQRATDEPALCRMRTDGSNYEVLKTGTYSQINITSYYVYFKDFKSGTMYRYPTTGSGTAEIFQP